MKSGKGLMILAAVLFLFGGGLCLVNNVALADSYDHYFSGYVYYNGAPVNGAKVYVTGHFQCYDDPPNTKYWSVKMTLTTNSKGYFKGNIYQGGDFTRADIKAKYSGLYSNGVTIGYPKHDNSNILLYINSPPPDDEEDPCGPGPNCN